MKQTTFSELKEQIEEWSRLDYINPKDIPAIELYMDQVTTFMDRQLGDNKRNPEDKILTKTMINNYSKNNLLPPSDKKKYSRDHIILLTYIYYLKNFLSISDIQHLLQPMTDSYFQRDTVPDMYSIYEDLFHLEQSYGIRIRESVQEIYEIADQQFCDKDDYLKTFAMIAMLSYDIYAKKQLVEKLIDSFHSEPPTKAELREARDLTRQKEKQARTRGQTEKK
ncbi:MAG: DUF1836 domain-containing protein [Lachnospiraceae bacterium]|nr:DUF1836 domain-containing protein [Lachnospiraceae bacterium]